MFYYSTCTYKLLSIKIYNSLLIEIVFGIHICALHILQGCFILHNAFKRTASQGNFWHVRWNGHIGISVFFWVSQWVHLWRHIEVCATIISIFENLAEVLYCGIPSTISSGIFFALKKPILNYREMCRRKIFIIFYENF